MHPNWAFLCRLSADIDLRGQEYYAQGWQEHSHLCSKVNVLTKPLRLYAKHVQPSFPCSLCSYGKDAGPPSCTSCIEVSVSFRGWQKKDRIHRWGRICKDTALKISMHFCYLHTARCKPVDLILKLHDVAWLSRELQPNMGRRSFYLLMKFFRVTINTWNRQNALRTLC